VFQPKLESWETRAFDILLFNGSKDPELLQVLEKVILP
jgi:hypothetical protein